MQLYGFKAKLGHFLPLDAGLNFMGSTYDSVVYNFHTKGQAKVGKRRQFLCSKLNICCLCVIFTCV